MSTCKAFHQKDIVCQDDMNILLKRKNLEIMQLSLNEYASIWIEPAHNNIGIEYIYVMSGILIIEHDNIQEELIPGDSFYVENIVSNVLIKVKERAKILYLSNIEVYDEYKEFIEKTKEIINSINEKDKFTKVHCQIVHSICISIYDNLQDKTQINYATLTLAALFHDIGKYYLPDELIKKHDDYTLEDIVEMKKHTLYGYNIVKPLFGDDVADAILHHHEYLDGSGYAGLKNNELSLVVRIICIANDFAILICDKPNGKGMTQIDAINKMLNNKYDKDISLILLDLVQNKKLEFNFNE